MTHSYVLSIFLIYADCYRFLTDNFWPSEIPASSPGVASFLSAVPIELWDRSARYPWSCGIVLEKEGDALQILFGFSAKPFGFLSNNIIALLLLQCAVKI